MSFLSSLFGGANTAAGDQTQAMLAAIGAAQNGANTANTDLTSATTNAVAPLQQNLTTANQGVTGLGNALGLNGAAGNQSALAQLQTTPGYQFTLGQGNNAINAAGAANGTLNSGNQATALSNYDSGLAQQNYGNYVNQLQPYLGASQNAASGISSAYQNLGNQQAGVQNNLINNEIGALTGAGNANASAALANSNQAQSMVSGGVKALSGLGSIFSDERLKDDIEPVGELFDGTNIYRYRYKGDDTMRIGVMAQEVQEKNPDAVIDVDGFLAVNYGKATDFSSDLGAFLRAA
jgi:hypothetical protein